ncbi:UNVERIFIED_CONTAM: hypothetical protein RMT77_012668 [Armadillidium vulgare]
MHLILVCFALFSVCHVSLSIIPVRLLKELEAEGLTHPIFQRRSGLAGPPGRAGLTGLSELSKLSGLAGMFKGLSDLSKLQELAGLSRLSELSKLQLLSGLSRLSELSKLQGSPPNIRDILQSQQESPSNLGLAGLLDQKLNSLNNRLSLLNKLQSINMRAVCPPYNRPVTSTETSGTAENTETPLPEEHTEHTEHTEHPGHTTHAEPSFEPTEPSELAEN